MSLYIVASSTKYVGAPILFSGSIYDFEFVLSE